MIEPPRGEDAKVFWVGRGGDSAPYLSRGVGEKIAVKGILTFPGWYVTTRKMARNLRVLNPKQIQAAIASDKEQVLDVKLTKRIVHQLEQRCRNVQM